MVAGVSSFAVATAAAVAAAAVAAAVAVASVPVLDWVLEDRKNAKTRVKDNVLYTVLGTTQVQTVAV